MVQSRFFRTSNPALNDKAFGRPLVANAEKMTLDGTIHKSGLLVVLLIGVSAWIWFHFYPVEQCLQLSAVGAIIGLILAFIMIFRPTTAPLLAPMYAIAEGVVVGGISSVYEMRYPGIVMHAVMLTFGIFVALLAAYSTRVIKPSQNFRLGIVAATGGIALVYCADFLLRLFGIPMNFLHDSGPLSIGISLFITIIAALNLVLDFDFIERGAEQGAPKYMEWYAAFGLLVTIVWLYLEILRLLGKTRRR